MKNFFFGIGLLIISGCMLGCDNSKTTSQNGTGAEVKSAPVSGSNEQPVSEADGKNSESTQAEPSNATEPANAVGASSDKTSANPATGTGTENPPASATSQPEQKSAEQKTAAQKSGQKSGVVHAITFDDLNCGMQADIVFRDWMLTERVKELDGQRVRIAGYMHPDAKQKGITEFILLRNTECKFGPAGQADHLIQVRLDPGVTTSFSTSPIEVVGQLTFKPFNGPDGNTWAIYEMTGESVGTPRHRPPSGKDTRPVRGG